MAAGLEAICRPAAPRTEEVGRGMDQARRTGLSADAGIGIRGERYIWVVLALLCLVYVLNFLDRQLLSILAKPIQDELGHQRRPARAVGWALLRAVLLHPRIPVAWFADRSNRVRILRVLPVLCGARATVACGMAQNYAQLTVARMKRGVSVKRAECRLRTPSSRITFASARRGTALGLFNLGPPIGQALGVAFGAKIAAAYDWRLGLHAPRRRRPGRGRCRVGRGPRAEARGHGCSRRPSPTGRAGRSGELRLNASDVRDAPDADPRLARCGRHPVRHLRDHGLYHALLDARESDDAG